MSRPERRAWRLETAAGTVLADHVEVATSLLGRARGLMLRRELPAGHGLLLQPCNSIHMLFMRFPIDVAFVDRDGAVLHQHHAIRPWRLGRLVRRARAAYELPPGTLARHGVERGTVLRLV